jgi:hypothetical protein
MFVTQIILFIPEGTLVCDTGSATLVQAKITIPGASGKPKFPYFGLGCLDPKSRRIR